MIFSVDIVKMGSLGEPEIKEIECLVVGGGFGAVALLRKLLRNGFDARVYEKGSGFGGIWHWNCYPGARVDTQDSNRKTPLQSAAAAGNVAAEEALKHLRPTLQEPETSK